MGTVLRFKNFKVAIYPEDHIPEHVHILGPDFEVKIDINDCKCYYARGVNQKTINRLEKFVKSNQELLLESWREINGEE